MKVWIWICSPLTFSTTILSAIGPFTPTSLGKGSSLAGMGKDDLWQKFVYPPSTRQGCTQEGGHTLRLNTERGRTCFAASDLTLAERQDFWQLTPSAGGSSPKLTLRALSSAKAPIVLVIDLDHLLVLFLIAISSTSSSWSQLIVVAWFLETHTVRIWLVSTKDVKTEIKSYSKTVQILLTGRGNRQTSSPATLSKLFLTLGLLLLVVLVLPNFQRDDVQWNQGFWLEL